MRLHHEGCITDIGAIRPAGGEDRVEGGVRKGRSAADENVSGGRRDGTKKAARAGGRRSKSADSGSRSRYCSEPHRSVAGSASAHFHRSPCRHAWVVYQARSNSSPRPLSTENTSSLHMVSGVTIARVTCTSPCSLPTGFVFDLPRAAFTHLHRCDRAGYRILFRLLACSDDITDCRIDPAVYGDANRNAHSWISGRRT